MVEAHIRSSRLIDRALPGRIALTNRGGILNCCRVVAALVGPLCDLENIIQIGALE
jgi:hypothetical protein